MATDYEAKGTLLRGYLAHLDEHGLTRAVRERATPAVQRIFDRRPIATDWVAGETLEALVEAVHEQGGEGLVRRMVTDSLNTTVSRILRPLGESLLRLFGVSPHTIFSRMDTINAPLFRGLSYRYEKLDERACLVEVRYPRVPGATAVLAWDEALAMIAKGTAPTAQPLEVRREGDGRTVVFVVRW